MWTKFTEEVPVSLPWQEKARFLTDRPDKREFVHFSLTHKDYFSPTHKENFFKLFWKINVETTIKHFFNEAFEYTRLTGMLVAGENNKWFRSIF